MPGSLECALRIFSSVWLCVGRTISRGESLGVDGDKSSVADIVLSWRYIV